MSTRFSLATAVTCAAAAMVLAVATAEAALIFYEPFSYSEGSLNGQNGGTGFSGAWTSSGTTSTVVASPGLTYGLLTTTGNRVAGIGSMSMKRSFSSAGLTGNGSTLYFSILFSATDTTAGGATAIPSFFSDSTGPYGQFSGFSVSYDIQSSTQLYMDARIGGSVLASTVIPGANYYGGVTDMVLGRITFSDTPNQDRLEVWRNPALGGDPGTPLFNVTGQWTDPGANNSFYMNKYDPPDRNIDEIRLGTTLVDVTPVPEPAACALAIVTAGLAAGVRQVDRHRRAR